MTNPRDGLRQGVVLALSLAQVAGATYVIQSGTNSFASPPPGGYPPIVPAGYAFAIWGPIYTGSVVYGIYQALPRQRDRDVHRVIGWWTALGFAGATAWILVAQDTSRLYSTVAILGFIALSLGTALYRLARYREHGHRILPKSDRWLVVPVLGVFFGWACVATFANIATTLREGEWTQPGGERLSTVVLVTVATVLAAWVQRWSRGNAWYALAVIWALVAVAVADFTGDRRTPDAVLGALALVSATIVGVATYLARQRIARPISATRK